MKATRTGTEKWKRDRKSTRLNSNHVYISYATLFFKATAPTEISPLSLHAALPISTVNLLSIRKAMDPADESHPYGHGKVETRSEEHTSELQSRLHLLCHPFF